MCKKCEEKAREVLKSGASDRELSPEEAQTRLEAEKVLRGASAEKYPDPESFIEKVRECIRKKDPKIGAYLDAITAVTSASPLSEDEEAERQYLIGRANLANSLYNVGLLDEETLIQATEEAIATTFPALKRSVFLGWYAGGN